MRPSTGAASKVALILSLSKDEGGPHPCGQARAPLKPQHLFFSFWSRAMLAIGVIAIFLGVILALNYFEFGRID